MLDFFTGNENPNFQETKGELKNGYFDTAAFKQGAAEAN